MSKTKKKPAPAKATLATLEKRIIDLENDATGRTKTVITRLNQAVKAFDPKDPNPFVGQLRDLASDLEHTL